MMNNPSDEKDRIKALNPEKSFMVVAPAGSGKTRLLVKRILVLLALVDNPEQVLAITFTRKAAREMSERVFEILEIARGDILNETTVDSELLVLAYPVVRRNEEKNWNIFDNQNRLRIQTIDSFCRNITNQYALETELSAVLEPVDNSEIMYSDASLALLKGIEENYPHNRALRVLLEYLGNDTELCVKLFTTLLSKREQWLPFIFDISKNANYFNEVISEAIKNSIRNLKITLQEKDSTLCDLINFSENFLSKDTKKNCRQFLILDSILSSEEDDVEGWKIIVNKIITSQGNYRKSITKAQGFPASEKEEKLLMLNFISWCEKQQNLLTQLNEVQNLPNLKSIPDNNLILNALATVLPRLVAELNVIFTEAGKCDHTQILIQSLQATDTSNDHFSETILNLDQQIKHILIDEYQDTSASQIRLIKNLVANWEPNGTKTIFCVGDAAQSIYGFRNPPSDKLKIEKNTFFGQIECIKLHLEKNFRSDPKLVDWVNKAFNSTDTYKNKILPGVSKEYGSVHTRTDDAQAKVNFSPFVGSDTEKTEADRIARECKQIIDSGSTESIAILVRSRSHVTNIISSLDHLNVPWEGKDIVPLREKMVVIDLISLTLALTSPANRIAWLSVLRSPVIGFSLEEILVLTSANDHCDMPIIQALSKHSEAPPSELSECGKKILLRVTPILLDAWSNRRRFSLRTLIEDTWIKLGGVATLCSQSDFIDVADYLNLLEQSSGTHLTKYSEFESSIKKLYSSSDQVVNCENNHNKISIMTIHKSKGLEFDHVFLPYLSKTTMSDDKPLFRWNEVAVADDSYRFLLAPRENVNFNKNEVFEFLKYLNAKDLCAEDKRLLYVACTRAIKTLHLSAEVKFSSNEKLSSPPKRSLLASIWPFLMRKIDTGEYSITKTEKIITLGNNRIFGKNEIRRLPHDFKHVHREAFALRNFKDSTQTSKESDKADSQSKNLGIVFHKLIEQISSVSLDFSELDMKSRLIPLIERISKNMTIDLNIHDTEKLSEALLSMLNDKKGLWILNNKIHANTEQTLNYISDEPKRIKFSVIDRSFVYEDCRWIIDYKLSAPKDNQSIATFSEEQLTRYSHQLDHYVRLYSNIEDRDIRVALYFPLIAKFLEYKYYSTVKD